LSDKIRIDDLGSPVLTEIQRTALEAAAATPVEMTVDAVLAVARRRTGLEDFGDERFVDRLRLWLDEVDADPTRTQLGKAMVFRMCARFATARLKVLDLLTRHPEIHDVRIEAPLIVVGLPRSGTTHLVNLLASDERFRSMPLWESYDPVDPQFDRVPGRVDDRRQRALREWEGGKALLPLQRLLHPMEPDHIHEECELQGIDFGGYVLEWIAHVPGWRDHYLAEDQTPRYEFMRDVLKVLQWQRGPSRWVLKSPQHLEQLGPLMSTFPDATVVMTHRDPLSVIQSAATMVAYSARVQRTKVDPGSVFDYWVDRIEHMLRASVRDRHLLPANRTVDVFFSEFMADELGTLERIYEAHGLPFAPQRAAAQTYLADHPRGKDGQVVYDIRADFGADPEVVRKRFAFYEDAFPIQQEVR
jgi:hypothetical protein